MKNHSWIKLYRDMTNDWLYSGSKKEPYDRFHAYMDIYLRANFKKNKTMYQGRVQETMPGQIRTSTEALANRWYWSSGKVRRFLSAMEADGRLRVERTPNGTLITITKWKEEQGETKSASGGASKQKTRKEETHDIDGNRIPF